MMSIFDVSFDVYCGKTLALVGESGSGKSVIARAILGILPDIAKAHAGRIILCEGDQPVDLLALNPNGREMRGYRGGSISMIFQEPMVSLSPLHTVGDQVTEALHLHREASSQGGKTHCIEMLQMVGFPDPELTYHSYPFELSGGMRQRAMIAMALICHPSLLIADEPTTALDVTIQAQTLKLIKGLQEKLDMAVIMITHDLGVVANVADDMVVIYHGEIMEKGSAKEVFSAPGHDYTKALLNAIPHFDMGEDERLVSVREVHAEVGAFLAQRQKQMTEHCHPHPENLVLEVSQLTKHFGARCSAWSLAANKPGVTAVDHVSLTIKRGECLGLVGESGSGKSTLSKLIARAIEPDSGDITFHGSDQSYAVHSFIAAKSSICFRIRSAHSIPA